MNLYEAFKQLDKINEAVGQSNSQRSKELAEKEAALKSKQEWITKIESDGFSAKYEEELQNNLKHAQGRLDVWEKLEPNVLKAQQEVEDSKAYFKDKANFIGQLINIPRYQLENIELTDDKLIYYNPNITNYKTDYSNLRVAFKDENSTVSMPVDSPDINYLDTTIQDKKKNKQKNLINIKAYYAEKENRQDKINSIKQDLKLAGNTHKIYYKLLDEVDALEKDLNELRSESQAISNYQDEKKKLQDQRAYWKDICNNKSNISTKEYIEAKNELDKVNAKISEINNTLNHYYGKETKVSQRALINELKMTDIQTALSDQTVRQWIRDNLVAITATYPETESGFAAINEYSNIKNVENSNCVKVISEEQLHKYSLPQWGLGLSVTFKNKDTTKLIPSVVVEKFRKLFKSHDWDDLVQGKQVKLSSNLLVDTLISKGGLYFCNLDSRNPKKNVPIDDATWNNFVNSARFE